MIYFETIGGLCNRMRSVSSAVFFAQKHKQELTVIWPCNDECNCKCNDLFDVSNWNNVKFIYTPYVGKNFLNRIRNFLYKNCVNILKKKCVYVYENISKDDLLYISENLENRNIYISSCEYWFESEEPFSIYIPQNSIQHAIMEIKQKLGNDCIGVHIRRGDNAVSINNSPTEIFVEKMQSLIQQNENTKFYLATDSELEIQKMQTFFGKDRIIYNSGAVLNRSSRIGIRDAVIDLYILAGTKMILGSFYSSFTETAGAIHKSPVIVCKNERN